MKSHIEVSKILKSHHRHICHSKSMIREFDEDGDSKISFREVSKIKKNLF